MPSWPLPSFPYMFPIFWGPLGSPFQLQVMVAFDSDPFAVAPVWTDITHDVQTIAIKRGRQTELARMEAGTATIRLKNRSGDYWPNNAGGPYYGKLLPGKAIQIRAAFTIPLPSFPYTFPIVWSRTFSYYLYTGFATGWPPTWLSQTGGQNPVVDIKCVDLIKNLSIMDINVVAPGLPQERSSARVARVLDLLGWPTDARDIDSPSQVECIESGEMEDEPAMAHLFTVQDTELGLLYIRGDGHVVFEDQGHRLKPPHTVSQAVFGDDVGENFYSNLVPEYDDQFIYNDIRITSSFPGATQQVASDAASQAAYGKRTFAKAGLLMPTDNGALAQALLKLRLYKQPLMRARSLKLNGARDPFRLWPKILGYDISTRITVRNNEAGIDEDYFIEAVSHKIDVQKWTWETSWQLSNADILFWALGVSGSSELGETTYLYHEF